MHRNQSVNVHQFAMSPRADVPRSSFRIQTTRKTTFDSGYLIPVYVDEVLPGDTFSLKMTAFARLATPIVPIMDNIYLDSFFFFVPNRLVWTNWVKFMGEQDNPADSISYTVPLALTPPTGVAPNTIWDYFGIPLSGVTGANAIGVCAFFPRAYNLIYNEWFRDENLQNSLTELKGDATDPDGTYAIVRRGKRHDYFTSALPFTQKGTAVPLPLTGNATVKTSSSADLWAPGAGVATPLNLRRVSTGTAGVSPVLMQAIGTLTSSGAAGATATESWFPSNLYADLSTVTATTINALRQSFQIQKLLERDARGGTRYTELIRAHFGVLSPDARLQRPEYLGGGSSYINISPVAQTTATGLTGGSTPLANLAAIGTVAAHGHGFTQSFTEHGVIIGLVSVRADLTYQQGLRKMWKRSTRYDFYFPAFAMLGEQAVYDYEIFANLAALSGNTVFGYQERWAEYRYNPSLITGLFNSNAAGTLDVWHLAQKFTAAPTLNTTFIQETPPISRILAVSSTGKEFLFDAFFDIKAARPLPMYSVPGLIDHF